MTHNAEKDVLLEARVSALYDFVEWVAASRAYNGSPHRHGQSLYNEQINAALPQWVAQWIAHGGVTETRATPPAKPADGGAGC